jgi:predicted metal-dependent enzyme (double-stranded beta helix superfamily)
MAAETRTETAQDRFISQMRDLFARESDPAKRWDAVPALLQELLADPAVQAAQYQWPVPSEVVARMPDEGRGRAGNLLFYEDPDYGFVMNATIHPAGRGQQAEPTQAHDHGQNWTAYGLLDGHERIVLYERTDDRSRPDHAEVRKVRDYIAGPGDVHLAAPGAIHIEVNIGERTSAVIIRSMRDGGPNNLHGRFDLVTGAYSESAGPRQVPTEMLPK